jgi:tripartite-type tricarboxylate transporter receptor subunit TctC
MQKVIAHPEVKAKLAAAGFEAFSGPPESLGQFVLEQIALWSKLIKDSGIEAQ